MVLNVCMKSGLIVRQDLTGFFLIEGTFGLVSQYLPLFVLGPCRDPASPP